MSTKKNQVSARISSIGCFAFALMATTISVLVSMYTGWQLGETLTDKLALGSVGVLAVFSAHFLLALCRPASVGVRIGAFALWIFCIAYVVFSHANFFALSQQLAGLRRVAALDQSSSGQAPRRDLMAILSDLGKVKTELAIKSRAPCVNGCFTLRAKVISLRSKLDVLNAEAGDFQRWQTRQDRLDEIKDSVRDDPVTSRLAKSLDMTVSQVGLAISLLFSVILEGVACLCWYIALLPRDSTMTHQDAQSVTKALDLPVRDITAITHSLPALPSLVEELVKEVRAGQLKLTVSAIREYCKCAQNTAADLRRQVAERLDADAQLA